MDSGVATRPITDWHTYRAKLTEFVYHTGVGMRAIFQAARRAKRQAHHLRRGRGRTRAARRPDPHRGRLRAADPDRPPAVIEHRLEKAKLRIGAGCRFRDRQSGIGRALSRMLDGLSQADGAPRRDAGDRQGRAAPQARRSSAPCCSGSAMPTACSCGMTGQYMHHLRRDQRADRQALRRQLPWPR